jgi:hypothetical protein
MHISTNGSMSVNDEMGKVNLRYYPSSCMDRLEKICHHKNIIRLPEYEAGMLTI